MYIPYEERIRMIDPSLEFVEALLPFGWVFLFHVRRDRKDYVLKGDDVSSSEEISKVNHEMAALKRERFIDSVPKFVQYYGWGEAGYAFLKDYVPGMRLCDIDRKLVEGKGLKKKLIATIAKLHLVGVANLDIEERNIIISPNCDDARLFDFNTAITNKGYNALTYGIGVAIDLSNLKRLRL
ncbi:serine/threonine protein kinase [Candidatus Pacearchaeota archaeon]|nr:serine/threonine protein kinase [Candidatus Pacearchaeota archaeon]